MTTAKAIGAFAAALLVLFLLLAITDAYRLPGFLGQHNQPQQAGWPWPVYDQNGRDRARPQPLDPSWNPIIFNPRPTYPYKTPSEIVLPQQGPKRDNPMVQWPVVRREEPPRNKHLPPLEYDYPYAGKMFIYRGSLSEVRMHCLNRQAIGCAYRSAVGAECHVWIINDDDLLPYDKLLDITYDVLLRHERAHCNNHKHDAKGSWYTVRQAAFEARY